jgi:hypothetical protein
VSRFVYSLADMEQLDALHRAAILAKRAFELASADKTRPAPFMLRREYEIASRNLAQFVRGLKQQVTL